MCEGCRAFNRNYALSQSLSREIAYYGGKTDGLRETSDVTGTYRIRRDAFGAAIDVDGVSFDSLRGWLSAAYGEPLFYTGPARGHGDTFLYRAKTVGVNIFISQTSTGAEITLLNPSRSPH